MKQIAIILIATFALFSCTKENMEGGSPTAQGVQVIFKTSDFAQLNTRAASETQLKDVTILQFKDGVLIQKELLENVSTSSAITLGFLEQLPAANLDEKGKLIEDGKENLIYFIANAKAVTGAEVGLNKGVSFAALKALKFGTNNLSEVLPMTGEYYGGVAKGATTQINVTLIRTVAKVNFAVNTTNFMVDGATPSIVVNSITLCDAPKEIAPYPCDNRPALPANGNPGIWADVMTPFPAYVAGAFESYGTEKNNSATPLTNYVTYMPENARGSFTSIANNKDKKPESLDAEHQGGLTYILVDLDYTTASGVAKNAKYKIYIGGDAAGDMNLLRNTQYNITTYIYGANETDTRITVTPIFDPESGLDSGDLKLQKPANCYLITPDADLTGFTIPLSQVRRGWNYIKSSEKNDALLSSFDNLIKTGNWEIITLWKTWSGTKNITGKKAEGISFENRPDASEGNYFATLTFPTGLAAGNNAVIALVDKNDNNKIYWSWHLWITDYNPDAQNLSQMNGQTHSYFGAAFQPLGAYYGKAMMDRNLGATATGVTGAIDPTKFANTTEAVAYYGLLYQFGRKDPFVGSSNGSTALVTIYGADGNVITDQDVAAGNSSNLANAVFNPMNFYTIASGNWTMPSEDLWNSTGSKSAFDPCPVGWRMPQGGATPTTNPWAGFGDGGVNSIGGGNYLGDYFKWKPANVSGSNIVGSAGGFYSYGEDTPTQAWYPASGVRIPSSGSINSVGVNSYYWSASPNGPTYGCSFYFISTNVSPNNASTRAYGFPVRCIQE